MNNIIELLKSNRMKSLLWRTSMMVVAFTCSALAENIGILDLDPTVVTFIGLILGEVSKYFNSQVK